MSEPIELTDFKYSKSYHHAITDDDVDAHIYRLRARYKGELIVALAESLGDREALNDDYIIPMLKEALIEEIEASGK